MENIKKVKAKDLHVGDYVENVDGSFVKIVKIANGFYRNSLYIKCANGDEGTPGLSDLFFVKT